MKINYSKSVLEKHWKKKNKKQRRKKGKKQSAVYANFAENKDIPVFRECYYTH